MCPKNVPASTRRRASAFRAAAASSPSCPELYRMSAPRSMIVSMYSASVVSTERSKARLFCGIEHYNEAVVLGDAPRGGACVHALAQLYRAA
jgi:hypothetical protein